MKLKKPCKSAFTLIEIIISLTLIGILLTFLLYTHHLNLKNTTKASNYYDATLLLKEKIEEVEIFGLQKLSEYNGAIKKENCSFFWKIDHQTFKNNLTKVTVTISWKENKLPQQITLSTLLKQD